MTRLRWYALAGAVTATVAVLLLYFALGFYAVALCERVTR